MRHLSPLLTALLALNACTSERYEVAEVTRSDLRRTVVATGRVIPPARVPLGTTVLGMIQEDHCEPGATVETGELIYDLEDSEQAAALASAEAGFQEAQQALGSLLSVEAPSAIARLKEAHARLDQAQDDHKRKSELLAAGIITQAEMDAAEAALQVAEAQHEALELQLDDLSSRGGAVRQARSAVAAAEANRNAAVARRAKTKVVSPGGGHILSCKAEEGAIVSPGAVLAVVAVGGAGQVEVAVEERNLPGLEPGRRAVIVADPYPDEPFDATVLCVAPVVDPARGTVDVKLAITDPPDFLKVDMTVTTEIVVQEESSVLLVPAEAVADGPDPFVMVLNGGRAVRRDIETGVRGASTGSSPQQLQVLQGLEEGELVLLARADGGLPEDGQEVKTHRRER